MPRLPVRQATALLLLLRSGIRTGMTQILWLIIKLFEFLIEFIDFLQNL